MYMQQSPPTNRNAEADPYTSNIQTAHTHNLSGRDTVIQPEYSPTDTLGVAGASKLATPNYSKRPSGNEFPPPLLIYVNFFSILPYLR